jgi:hypothetical protein
VRGRRELDVVVVVFVGVFGWRHGVGVSRLGGCRRL